MESIPEIAAARFQVGDALGLSAGEWSSDFLMRVFTPSGVEYVIGPCEYIDLDLNEPGTWQVLLEWSRTKRQQRQELCVYPKEAPVSA